MLKNNDEFLAFFSLKRENCAYVLILKAKAVKCKEGKINKMTNYSFLTVNLFKDRQCTYKA